MIPIIKPILKRVLLVILFLLPLNPVKAENVHTATVQPATVQPATAQADADVLRIMSFNIWVGGELVDFSKVVEAIEAADADVVGLQETSGNTRLLADALGWHYASERTHIISRLPLIEPAGANGDYLFVQLRPGEVVALANIHLPSDPYGPYAVRDGLALEEVLEIEQSTRVPAIEAALLPLADLIEAGVPVFLTGDFNTPSHRDWTEEVMAVRDQVRYAVEWPVSMAVEAVGFQDTYRTVYPDPVAQPGNTWTYGYPNPRLKLDEMIDRIDMIFASEGVEVVNSEIVGETGGPNVDIGIAPFPSDHRGVVSTVRVTPSVPPFFVAADRRTVELGSPVVVRYHAPNGEETDRIAVVHEGGDATTDALMWLPPYEASYFGSVTFGSGHLDAGIYDVVLLDGEDEEVARNSFWLVQPDVLPTVSTDQATYAAGDEIAVSWLNTAGNRNDWVGLYTAGDPDLYNGYWAYAYTNGDSSGTVIFDQAVLGDMPLAPGAYEMRLLLDDGYAILATSTFTVTE